MAKFALFSKDSLIRTLFRIRRREGFSAACKLLRASIARRLTRKNYRAITFSSASAANRVLIEEQHLITVPEPRFAAQIPAGYSGSGTTRLLSPKLEIAEFDSVTVLGGSDLIFQFGDIIHSDFYDPKSEVCPAEAFGYLSINHESSALNASAWTTRRLDSAISLISQCEGNYAHFLVEVLPKLALIESKGLYENVPLLMASWTHPNIHAAVKVVSKSRRKVILLDRWETIKVTRLIVVSPTAYIVAEHRDHLAEGSTEGIANERFPFSRTALLCLKENVIEAIGRYPKPNAKDRYYIKRANTGNPRKAINARDLEQVARLKGFKVIDPGSMSFENQVALFQTAAVVAGQVGAALANTLFANEGCRILGLAPYFPGGNYHFWANFAGVLRHDLRYVIGDQIDSIHHTMHRDYVIEVSLFESALDEMLENNSDRLL